MHHFKKAFTLIELLVVISIISLLIAILLPALSSAREQAKAVVCQSNLRQVGIATALYSTENKDYELPCKFPQNAFGIWSSVLINEDYLPANIHDTNADNSVNSNDEYTSKSVFVCPSSNPGEVRIVTSTSFPLPFAGTGSAVTYGYNTNLGYLRNPLLDEASENNYLRTYHILNPSGVYRMIDANHNELQPRSQITSYNRLTFGTRHLNENVNVLFVGGNVSTRNSEEVPLMEQPTSPTDLIKQDDPWLGRHLNH